VSTNADLYCDALAARRWHQRANLRGVVPADLEIEAIRSRYLSLTTVNELNTGDVGRGVVPMITFVDETYAVKNRSGYWIAP